MFLNVSIQCALSTMDGQDSLKQPGKYTMTNIADKTNFHCRLVNSMWHIKMLKLQHNQSLVHSV